MAPLLNIANTRLIHATVDLLDPGPKDKIPSSGLLTNGGERHGSDPAQPIGFSVSVKCTDVADLPFPARTFDKVLTVNIYYWPNLRAGLRETAYEPREFAEILEESGFKLVTLQHRDLWRIPDLVIALGERR